MWSRKRPYGRSWLSWKVNIGTRLGLSLDLLGRTLAVTEQAGRATKGAAVFGPRSPPPAVPRSPFPRCSQIYLCSSHPTRPHGRARQRTGVHDAGRGSARLPELPLQISLPTTSRAGVPGLTFHDLRRANASGLVLAGADLKTAQTRLGHSSPRLTLRVHTQATSEADPGRRDALEDRFFALPPGCTRDRLGLRKR